MKQPYVGLIALFAITATMATEINRRRTTGPEIASRIAEEKWPLGAQAHIGNSVKEGDVFPFLIIQVWSRFDDPPVNGQLLLDGTDSYWVTSAHQSEEYEIGKYHLPPEGTGLNPLTVGYEAAEAAILQDIQTGGARWRPSDLVALLEAKSMRDAPPQPLNALG